MHVLSVNILAFSKLLNLTVTHGFSKNLEVIWHDCNVPILMLFVLLLNMMLNMFH